MNDDLKSRNQKMNFQVTYIQSANTFCSQEITVLVVEERPKVIFL